MIVLVVFLFALDCTRFLFRFSVSGVGSKLLTRGFEIETETSMHQGNKQKTTEYQGVAETFQDSPIKL